MPARRGPSTLAAVTALALVAPALSSCQLLGGGSSLDDALEVVPAGATGIDVVDRAAVAERAGVDDVATGDDEERLDEYVEALADQPVAGTSLLAGLRPMQEAAFSELDVVWGVLGFTDQGAFSIYRVDDDVDLDDVVADLEEAGLVAGEGSDGRSTFEPALGAGDDAGSLGGSPADFTTGALVDPDEHLVVTGGAVPEVEAVLAGEADSVADTGTYDDLRADVDDDLLFASLSADPPCARIRPTPEGADATGSDGLGAPAAVGVFVAEDEGAVTARLQFDDADAAEADAAARRDYLDDGMSLRTAQPLADPGTFEVEQEDDVVTVAVDLEEPSLVRQLVQSGDAFVACAPRS